jgi:hypothetical protein
MYLKMAKLNPEKWKNLCLGRKKFGRIDSWTRKQEIHRKQGKQSSKKAWETVYVKLI